MRVREMYVEWENGNGEIRYQPKTKNGALLEANWVGDRMWTTMHMGAPVLYRSRARAERVARRQEKRTAKNAWMKR